MTEGLFVLHVFVGLLFAAHGAQKLFGSFNGPGVEGVTGFMGSLGLEPARFHGIAAGVIEFAGGLLIALGLVTPFAAAALIAVLFALSAVGPGDVSLDAALNLDLAGFGWALGALAVGVAGGIGAIVSGKALGRRGDTAHPQAA